LLVASAALLLGTSGVAQSAEETSHLELVRRAFAQLGRRPATQREATAELESLRALLKQQEESLRALVKRQEVMTRQSQALLDRIGVALEERRGQPPQPAPAARMVR